METVIKQTIHYMMVSRIDLGLARSLGRVKMCSGSRCTLILWLFVFWHCGQNGNNDQTDHSLHESVTHWPWPRVISRQAQNVEWLPLYTDFVIIHFLAWRTEGKQWSNIPFTAWRLHSLTWAQKRPKHKLSGNRCAARIAVHFQPTKTSSWALVGECRLHLVNRLFAHFPILPARPKNELSGNRCAARMAVHFQPT